MTRGTGKFYRDLSQDVAKPQVLVTTSNIFVSLDRFQDVDPEDALD